MFDITEEDVDSAATVIEITETILMNLYFSRNPLAIQSWPNKNVVEFMRFAI